MLWCFLRDNFTGFMWIIVKVDDPKFWTIYPLLKRMSTLFPQLDFKRKNRLLIVWNFVLFKIIEPMLFCFNKNLFTEFEEVHFLL